MTARTGAATVGPRREPGHRPRRRLREAARGAVAAAVLVMAAPAWAQTAPADEPSPDENAVGALSPVSLARIRAALQADRERTRTVFGNPDDGWIVPPRSPVEIAPGLGLLEGIGLFNDLTRGREPAPRGGPSHQAMMNQMQPREMTEMAQTDVLGIGTASAFAVGLPYVVRKVTGWLSGPGSRFSSAPTEPVLTSTQEAAVLEDMQAEIEVMEATLVQRGRTVALSLLVRADTGPRAAREIGERFVRLVGRQSAAGPDAFDYVVSIRSPNELIARGGKPTSDPLVRW